MSDDPPAVGIDHPTVVPGQPATDHDHAGASRRTTEEGTDHPTVVPGTRV